MTLQEVLTALRNADAAGDVEAARRLAQIAGNMQAGPNQYDTQIQDLDRRIAERRAERAKPETTFGGEVKEAFKGVVPGAIGLLETAGTGISALLPEDTEKSAREAIKELAGIAKKPFEAGAGYEDSIGRKLGEGLGSTLPFFALGPAGLAGRVAAGGLGVSAGAGEARQRAEAEGATAEQRSTATLMGAPTGLLDLLAPNIGPLKNIITTALARGGIEGATEAAQQVAQNLITKGIYKPEQAVVEGAGEEGAYGAGVGAIASVILDLTLGRRARGARTTEPAETAETKPKTPEQQLLGYTAEPFTPVAMPDGSVITTKAEYDEYVKGKEGAAAQRKEDLRTSDPLAGLSEFDRNLARRGKEAALAETFQSQEPDLFGEIVPKREEVKTEAETEPTVKRDEKTRDMIDELETADIEKMIAEDDSAKLRDLIKERDKAITETDKRVEEAQKSRTAKARMELLEPLVKSEVPNIQEAFVQKLEREGYTDTTPSETEAKIIESETRRAKINSLLDRYFSTKPKAEESTVEPSAPAENAEMEALIPEKKPKAVQEQPSFPGMGKPKGATPQAFSEEELAGQEAPFTGRSGEAPRSHTSTEPFVTTLTAEVLDKTGLPKQSGFYKQLLNLDMADKANWPVMREVFGRVRTNANVKPATKQAIERMAMQAFGGMAKQQELFPEGKKGAKAEKPAKPAKEKPSEPAGRRDQDKGDDRGATGTRTVAPEPSVPKPAATERPVAAKPTEAPKSAGLGDRGQPVRDAGKREKVEPGALKEAPKAEAKAEKPKAEAPARTAESRQGKGLPLGGDNAYQAAKEQGEVDHAIRTLAADAYLNTAEDYSIKKAQAMIKGLEDGKVPELKFGKNNANGPGTGGKYAKEFYESLDDAEKTKFRRELQGFLYQEVKTKQYLDRYNKAQEIARTDVSGIEDADALHKDINKVATALHPMVVRMLRNNNLTGALRFVADQKLGRASDVAAKLAGKLDGVDVEIVDFQSKSPSGLFKQLLEKYPAAQTASGAYITTKNGKRIVWMDSNTGMDVWTLLHEATHGAVNSTLDNPANPLTKKLTQLFEDVKGSLDTAYGATDVKEFAAEAFSDPEFQQKLASINPKGEAITAWQRFVHSVKNFLRSMIGMPTKGMGSALDSADYMIEAIVNGHPGTSNSLQTVSLLNKGKEFFDAMGKRAESLPGLNAERVGRIHEMLTGSLPGTAKNIIRQALPLNALVEVAQKYIPMAPKLDVLVGERAGAENKRNQALEPIIDRVGAWAKANPKLVDKLNNVIYRSTLDQVDPSKPRSEYVGKMDDSGNKKDVAWDEMQADWKALGASGQTTYKLMRDTYKKMYEDVRKVLDARIDGALEDANTRNKVKAEIYQRLFASGHIEPYFPLTRSGKHWLSYSLGNEFFVEAYETNYERDRAVKELRAEGATDIQRFANLNQVNYRKAPATSFVNNILRTLEANKVDANVTEEVMRLFLNTLPETSFAQSFRRRKGTLGFQRDAIGALRMKAFNLSRQLSNMEYGAKLEKLRADMKEYVRTQGNQEPAVDMMNELDARIDYAISPNVPQWAKLATSFGFNMTLGFNVSSAIVNMSQIPLVVMPYLGGKYGFTDTTKAIGRAARYFTGSGFKREVEMLVPTDKGEKTMKVRAFPSLDNYDFDAKDAPKHLKILSEVAGARGQLNRSQVYDILDVDESQSVLTKINAASGFVFHHGERMNRQVAMIAAYELELQRLVGAGKDLTTATEKQQREAADYAVYVTELTNGGTAAAAAPRLAQGPIGKVIFMYKRYGVSMYYMLFKTAREALKDANPEVRAAAKRQLAGIYASSALMAGVQGIPMFGIAAMVYNLILKDDDDDDFDTAARKYLGEGVYSGAINALTGVNVATRLGLSDLLFRDNNTRPSDSVMLSLMEAMGGPVIGVASRVERGLGLIADGNIERGVEQILPSVFGNAFKAVRFATEGANTLRGDPIVGEVGPWNSFAQFFGFAPAEYTRQLEINSSLKNIERKALEDRTKLLRRYYIAMRMGDGQEAAEVAAEMLKYNRKHPGAAITGDVIKRSMAQHMKTSKEMYHGITLNKSLRPQLLTEAAEYEPDVDE